MLCSLRIFIQHDVRRMWYVATKGATWPHVKGNVCWLCEWTLNVLSPNDLRVIISVLSEAEDRFRSP